MDVICQFLEERNGEVNLRALLLARNHLALIQSQKSFLSPSDIKDSFLITNILMSEIELDFHRALLMETCLQPCLGNDGRIKLKLREDMIANDVLFTSSLLNTINVKVRGENYHSIQELKKHISVFLSAKVERDRSRSFHPHYPTDNHVNVNNMQLSGIMSPTDYRVREEQLNFLNDGNGMPVSSTSHRPNINMVGGSGGGSKLYPAASLGYPANQQPQYLHLRRNIEMCEPVIRFLAQIRKQGMDILFPQDVHDKILCSIFVAVQLAKNPAHRELIDMVMSVKESNMFPNMQSVSKTKIRGILALLKHCDVMTTSGIEGLPVNLYLSTGVNSYQCLRERHDSYLLRFIHENHIPMPKDLWIEIVWKTDLDYRNDSLAKISGMIEDLRTFFVTRKVPHPRQSHPSSPATSGMNDMFPYHESNHLNMVNMPQSSPSSSDNSSNMSPGPPSNDTYFHRRLQHLPQHQQHHNALSSSQQPLTHHIPMKEERYVAGRLARYESVDIPGNRSQRDASSYHPQPLNYHPQPQPAAPGVLSKWSSASTAQEILHQLPSSHTSDELHSDISRFGHKLPHHNHSFSHQPPPLIPGTLFPGQSSSTTTSTLHRSPSLSSHEPSHSLSHSLSNASIHLPPLKSRVGDYNPNHHRSIHGSNSEPSLAYPSEYDAFLNASDHQRPSSISSYHSDTNKTSITGTGIAYPDSLSSLKPTSDTSWLHQHSAADDDFDYHQPYNVSYHDNMHLKQLHYKTNYDKDKISYLHHLGRDSHDQQRLYDNSPQPYDMNASNHDDRLSSNQSSKEHHSQSSQYDAYLISNMQSLDIDGIYQSTSSNANVSHIQGQGSSDQPSMNSTGVFTSPSGKIARMMDEVLATPNANNDMMSMEAASFPLH